MYDLWPYVCCALIITSNYISTCTRGFTVFSISNLLYFQRLSARLGVVTGKTISVLLSLLQFWPSPNKQTFSRQQKLYETMSHSMILELFFDTLRFTFDTSPFDFDTSPFDFDAFNFKAF